MGKLKRRIRPSDITINIGQGAPIPKCPIEGERYQVVSSYVKPYICYMAASMYTLLNSCALQLERSQTWQYRYMVGLLEWSNQPKRFQVCFPGSKQFTKGTKWQAKIWEVSKIEGDEVQFVCHRDFELACTNNCVSSWLWQDHIHKIRQNYTKDFRSKDTTKKQIAVATYLIDKLALRAGNEKVLSYWTYYLQWFYMMGHSCTQDIFVSAYILRQIVFFHLYFALSFVDMYDMPPQSLSGWRWGWYRWLLYAEGR